MLISQVFSWRSILKKTCPNTEVKHFYLPQKWDAPQLKSQQFELSVGLAESLKSKLEWALNQAWLEAKNSQKI